MTKVVNTKEKDWRLLEFFVPIEERFSDGEDFIIRGVAINETTTLNNVKYVAEELIKAAPTFRNVPILCDHINEVRNIVGRTTEKVDFNPNFNRIEYEGKIMVEDLTEEEDGSMKAIGIHGLELSLVAVPGDNQANLAQAMQQGLVLKEKAKLDKLNTENGNMAEDEKKTEEPKESTEETTEETEAEEPKEEPKEEPAKENVQNINVKVDTAELSSMKKQISELKELLIKKKKVNEDAEEESEDETKGEVSSEKEEVLNKLDSMIFEKSRTGYALSRDYSKESSDTKLLRLVR